MVWFLLLLIVAIVLGFLGAILKGLLYLLIIGVIVFVIDLIYLGWRLRRRGMRAGR